jgi:predicted phage-related endonuclease
MVCHLDFRAWGNPSLLIECKTRAYMAGWGEDGSAEIPVDVWVQVQHEMAVVNATEAHVAVLFGHHTFRVYVIKRDEAFIEKLIEKLDAWWNMHYLARVPPLPSGAEVDTERMKADHPDHDDTLKAATPEQSEVVARLRQAILNEQQTARAAEELRNRVRLFIGEAAGITGPFGSITWKKSRDGTSVDWEQVAVTYGNVIDELLEMANPGDDDDAVSRLRIARSVYETAESLATTTKPGSRRFMVNFKEESSA